MLNALNSEDGGLKVRFSLATIAFDRESAQMLSNAIVAREKRTFKPLSSLFSAFSNLKGVENWEGVLTTKLIH